MQNNRTVATECGAPIRHLLRTLRAASTLISRLVLISQIHNQSDKELGQESPNSIHENTGPGYSFKRFQPLGTRRPLPCRKACGTLQRRSPACTLCCSVPLGPRRSTRKWAGLNTQVKKGITIKLNTKWKLK